MSIVQEMTDILEARFAPARVTVADDSAKHAGHAGAQPGGNTHFSVTIISPVFEGMSRVGRHRAIYQALDRFIKAGVHALAIEAKTELE